MSGLKSGLKCGIKSGLKYGLKYGIWSGIKSVLNYGIKSGLSFGKKSGIKSYFSYSHIFHTLTVHHEQIILHIITPFCDNKLYSLPRSVPLTP